MLRGSFAATMVERKEGRPLCVKYYDIHIFQLVFGDHVVFGGVMGMIVCSKESDITDHRVRGPACVGAP